MSFKLGCPNCGFQIEVSATAEDQTIGCAGCEREYRVPPLPKESESAEQPVQPRTPSAGRRSSRARQTRFNLIVSGIATVTVILSVMGMLWLRGENQVHGDTSGNNDAVPSDASEVAAPSWNEDDLLADFPPVQTEDLDRYVGEYEVVGELTDAQKHVFAAPAENRTSPATLRITRQRLSTETLYLRFADRDESRTWSEQVAPTSVRLGHGFHLVATFRPALTILGAYSVEDFTDYDVHCSVDSHRYIDGKIVVTRACLNKEEFERKAPLRDRNHLCRVVSTYTLDGDTLRISRRASGADRELTRRFVSMLQAQTINSRRLIAQELADLEQAWLDGQTLELKRVSAPPQAG